MCCVGFLEKSPEEILHTFLRSGHNSQRLLCVFQGGVSQPGPVLSPRGCLSVSEDIFGRHGWGCGRCFIDIQWVEVRDAAKRPHTHRTAPHSSDLAPNVRRAEVEKPCWEGWEGVRNGFKLRCSDR